jgi:CHAT domain-containing protein/tetratricopeptide (TPR) repeat protein
MVAAAVALGFAEGAGTALLPRQPQSGRIAGRESQTYLVKAGKGQFLQARVEQDRLPFAVRWSEPGGRTVAEAQNYTLDGQPIVLSMVTTDEGTYSIELRLQSAATRAADYRIELSLVRTAREEDSNETLGETAYNEGHALLSSPGVENARKAIAKFEEARALWRKNSLEGREALAELQLSEAWFLAGDVKTSLEWSGAALKKYRQIDDDRGIQDALNNSGVAYSNLGAPRRAVECYLEALPFARKLRERFSEGSLLNNLGRSYSNLSEIDTAIHYLNQALTVWRDIKEVRWQAITLNNLGLAYRGKGEFDRAREMLDQALVLRRASGDVAGEATTASNLGLIDFEQEDYKTALERFERSLALRRRLGNPREIAFVLHQIGSCYVKLGDAAKAQQYLEPALEDRLKSGDRIGEVATLNMLARSYLLDGHPERALELLDQALAITRDIGTRIEEAVTLSNLARTRDAMGEPKKALELAESAIRINETVRGSVADPESRATYLAAVRVQYEFMTSVLMELSGSEREEHYVERGLENAEREHARGLMDLLEEARVDIREGVDQSILGREKDLRARLTKSTDERARLLSSGTTGPQPTRLDREISEITRQLSDLQAEIRRQSPRYAAIPDSPVLSTSAIQRELLDRDTALLEYSLGDDHSYMWLVTSEHVTASPLPGRKEIERLARNAYRALSQGQIADPALAELSRAILGPVVGDLTKPRLVIVADGGLLYIPFGALPLPVKPAEMLINRMEVVYLPSASSMALIRSGAATRPAATRAAAILADPVFRSDDPRVANPVRAVSSGEPATPDFERLQSSRKEAVAVASLLPGADVRMDFDATRQFLSEPGLDQYRILHLATHSLLNSRHPEQSAVAFSLVDRQGRPVDGLLPLHEVLRLKLGADLVVLSACETALGKEVLGEGLVGLTRAFMLAGSPRVVASLWRVADQATAEFMKLFYTAMVRKNLPPSAALRVAQLEIRKQPRWARPYYWAGFVLEGDWR